MYHVNQVALVWSPPLLSWTENNDCNRQDFLFYLIHVHFVSDYALRKEEILDASKRGETLLSDFKSRPREPSSLINITAVIILSLPPINVAEVLC